MQPEQQRNELERELMQQPLQPLQPLQHHHHFPLSASSGPSLRGSDFTLRPPDATMATMMSSSASPPHLMSSLWHASSLSPHAHDPIAAATAAQRVTTLIDDLSLYPPSHSQPLSPSSSSASSSSSMPPPPQLPLLSHPLTLQTPLTVTDDVAPPTFLPLDDTSWPAFDSSLLLARASSALVPFSTSPPPPSSSSSALPTSSSSSSSPDSSSSSSTAASRSAVGVAATAAPTVNASSDDREMLRRLKHRAIDNYRRVRQNDALSRIRAVIFTDNSSSSSTSSSSSPTDANVRLLQDEFGSELATLVARCAPVNAPKSKRDRLSTMEETVERLVQYRSAIALLRAQIDSERERRGKPIPRRPRATSKTSRMDDREDGDDDDGDGDGTVSASAKRVRRGTGGGALPHATAVALFDATMRYDASNTLRTNWLVNSSPCLIVLNGSTDICMEVSDAMLAACGWQRDLVLGRVFTTDWDLTAEFREAYRRAYKELGVYDCSSTSIPEANRLRVSDESSGDGKNTSSQSNVGQRGGSEKMNDSPSGDGSPPRSPVSRTLVEQWIERSIPSPPFGMPPAEIRTPYLATEQFTTARVQLVHMLMGRQTSVEAPFRVQVDNHVVTVDMRFWTSRQHNPDGSIELLLVACAEAVEVKRQRKLMRNEPSER